MSENYKQRALLKPFFLKILQFLSVLGQEQSALITNSLSHNQVKKLPNQAPACHVVQFQSDKMRHSENCQIHTQFSQK